MSSFAKLVLWGVITCQSCLAAGLSWSTPVLEVPCEPGQKKVVAEFSYSNQSDEPVTITTIRSSCGCTVVEKPATAIAPGEGGALEVVFTVGERVGPQRKTIRVTSKRADEPESVATLTLKTDIPELGSIRPRMLLWRINEGESLKVVRVDAPDGVTWSIPEDKTDSIPFNLEPRFDEETGVKQLAVRPLLPLARGKWSVPITFTKKAGETSIEKNLFLVVR